MSVLAIAPLPSAILGALVAGLVVTVAFSFVILGITRFGDLRRSGRGVAAAGYATLGAVAGLVAIGTVVVGLVVLTSK
jgi:uncharacterized membrane protein YjfL (UPF0719 family)